MKRNRMRRFFQQKQYAIASLVLFAAIAAMTGMYVSNRITNERQEQELAQKQQELADQSLSMDNHMDQFVNPDKLPEEQEEDLTSVTSIIKPQETENTENETQADKEMQDTKQNASDESDQIKEEPLTTKQPEQAEDKEEQKKRIPLRIQKQQSH